LAIELDAEFGGFIEAEGDCAVVVPCPVLCEDFFGRISTHFISRFALSTNGLPATRISNASVRCGGAPGRRNHRYALASRYSVLIARSPLRALRLLPFAPFRSRGAGEQQKNQVLHAEDR